MKKEKSPRDRIVCTRCGVISRGFVGDCHHVVQALRDEKRRFMKAIREVIGGVYPADGVEGCGCIAEVQRKLMGLKS